MASKEQERRRAQETTKLEDLPAAEQTADEDVKGGASMVESSLVWVGLGGPDTRYFTGGV